MKPGDLVRVMRLPKFWGAKDIRGNVGIILHPDFDSDGKLEMNWIAVMINGKRWPLPKNCVEIVNESQ